MHARHPLKTFVIGTLMRGVAFALMAAVLFTVSEVSGDGLSSLVAYTLIALVTAAMIAIFLAATLHPRNPPV